MLPRTTKVAAIATPPEMLRLTTGERRVILLHCLEDRLCVWHPATLTDLSYNVVLIDGQPSWSGRARHAYGHLLFTSIEEGTYRIDYRSHGLALISLTTANGPSVPFFRLLARDVLIYIRCHGMTGMSEMIPLLQSRICDKS